MALQILNEQSHLDHGLSKAVLAHLKRKYKGCTGFMLETITLPKNLGTVESALYGPAAGDAPIRDSQVYMSGRGLDRTWKSRMVKAPMRQTRKLTVIAGPMGPDVPCGLYTAYGGPAAPREPGDPSMNEQETAEAVEFWSVHALADGKNTNPIKRPDEMTDAEIEREIRSIASWSATLPRDLSRWHDERRQALIREELRRSEGRKKKNPKKQRAKKNPKATIAKYLKGL